MTLTNHAIDQLYERYEKWGLNVTEFLFYIKGLKFSDKDKYRMVLFDDIPIVIICDCNEIITVYPHPVDAAEEYLDLVRKQKVIRGLRSSKDYDKKKIEKLEKKVVKLQRQIKESWK